MPVGAFSQITSRTTTDAVVYVMLQFLAESSMQQSTVCLPEIACACDVTEESEAAQARLKGLDESAPTMTSAASKPRKDVNTFINNQLKFTTSATPAPLPASQLKCNILKAKASENINLKNGTCRLSR